MANLASLAAGANVRATSGNFWGAKEAQAEKLRIKQELLGHESLDICDDIVFLASIARQSGQVDEALLLADRAVKIAEGGAADTSPQLTSAVTAEMASIHREKGDLDRALLLSRRVLAIEEEMVDRGQEGDEVRVAAARDTVGIIKRMMGKFEEATALHLQALKAKQAALGPDHADIASTLMNLGVCADEAADYAKGKEWKSRAMDILLATVGPDHPQTGQALIGLGESAKRVGDLDEARNLFERAVLVLRASLGSSHPLLATALNNLAQAQKALGRHDEALLLLQQSVSIKKEVLPPNHPSIATALSNLATLHEEVYKDLEKSLELRRSALEMLSVSLGKSNPQVATHMHNMAVTYSKMGEYESAVGLYDEALQIDEATYGPDHPQVATDLNAMATFRFHMGQWQLSRWARAIYCSHSLAIWPLIMRRHSL